MKKKASLSKIASVLATATVASTVAQAAPSDYACVPEYLIELYNEKEIKMDELCNARKLNKKFELPLNEKGCFEATEEFTDMHDGFGHYTSVEGQKKMYYKSGKKINLRDCEEEDVISVWAEL